MYNTKQQKIQMKSTDVVPKMIKLPENYKIDRKLARDNNKEMKKKFKIGRLPCFGRTRDHHLRGEGRKIFAR